MRYIVLILVALTACKPYEGVTPLQKMEDIVYPYPVDKVNVMKDIEVAYIEEGSGSQTILFIHGLGSYLPAWKRNIEGLKENYHCIAIDLPGYGRSSKGKYTYDMKFFADVVADFIKVKGLENVTVVGHSMGGQIAITTALYHKALIDKMVLVAPAGFETFHEGQKQWFRDVLTARGVFLTSPENIQTNIAYNFYNYPAEADFMIADRIAMRSAADFEWYCYAVVESVKGMVDQPVYDFLDQVAHPTLVIFGSNDNLIPNRYLNPGSTEKVAKDGTSQLKNAQLKMIPKTGHFAMFESANQVNQFIREYLK